MKTAGLARIEIDGRHVAGLRYALDEARLGAAMAAVGVTVKLYAGKSEGRVLELARQLARTRAQVYVFHVSPASLAVTCTLAAELRLLAPAVEFAFWGRAEGVNPALAERVRALATWIESDILAEVQVALGAVLAAPIGSDPVSPYLSGMLTGADLGRKGLALSTAKLFAEELGWMASQPLTFDAPLTIDARAADSAELVAMAGLLERVNPAFALDIHAHAQHCSDAFFSAVPPGRPISFVLDGDSAAMTTQAGAWQGAIKPAESEEQRVAKAAVYGRNGNVVLHTGSYFDAKQTPGIYHLELPLAMEPSQRSAVYDWAANSMDIRSAAVLKGSSELVLEHLSTFEAPGSVETGGWPKHAYSLGVSPQGEASMTFDGVSQTAMPIRYVAMSQLAAAPLAVGTTTFVTMETAQDAQALSGQLSAMHGEGHIMLRNPRQAVYFENTCRWTNFGNCRLPVMRRVQVQPDLTLRACRDAGAIGTVGEDYDRIVINVKQRQQMEQVRRGCASCPVVSQCSQCSQLPDTWGGQYCSIRKTYPQTSLYFEMPILSQLIKPLLKDREDDIACRVSYTDLPAQHYRGPAPGGRSGKRPVIVSFADQHLAWWRGTRRLIRLSPPLALMAEAWWTGAQDEDIVSALVDSFQVERGVALTSLQEGMQKLREGQVVQ